MLRAASEASVGMTVLEQAIFLAVGVFLWWTAFGAPNERKHAAAGAGALLLTSIHMTLLGALLALSPRSLYGAGQVTCLGLVLEAEQDQHLGGVIMLLIGAIVYLTGGLVLVARVLEAKAARAPMKPLISPKA
jgi:putative membrane protein